VETALALASAAGVRACRDHPDIRRVVGRSIADHFRAELVDALAMAAMHPTM
jgi:hypothetical protein